MRFMLRLTDPARRTPASTVGSPWVATSVVLVGWAVFTAVFVIVGADAMWLVALGERVIADRSVPTGIPFAEAPSADWPNVLVLAEVLLALINRMGPIALPVLQVVVDVVALGLLALGARRSGARDRATAGVLVLVGVGSLASLVIVRVQVLSLIPFAVMLLLLRRDHRAPSRGLWALPVLTALWSNLHGAVLLGVCVAGVYLGFSRMRRRPLETLMIGLATVASLLVTPAGWRTVPYYLGVMDNEAAARGTDLWAAPSPSQPFDVLLGLAVVVLLVLFGRSRPPLWEWLAVAGLVLGTATAARHGVWLLMLLAATAAAGRGQHVHGQAVRESPRPPRGVALLALSPLVATAVAVAVVAARGDASLPAEPALVDAVREVAGTRVVLAPEPLAESLAAEGVRVWMCDPIDAFSARDQAAFLDFLQGSPGGAAAVLSSRLVVVKEGTAQERLVAGTGRFSVERTVGDWALYVR
jgi:hypothetical protein